MCNHLHTDGRLAIYGETDERGASTPYAICDLCGFRWHIESDGAMVPTERLMLPDDEPRKLIDLI